MSTAGQDEFERLQADAGIDLAALPEGAVVKTYIQGEPVVVARHRGRYCALSAKCTHMGAPLDEGILVDGEIHCPWHHARFSLESGEAIAAPAFSSLTRYDTVVRDGRVFVKEPLPLTLHTAPSATSRVVILGGGAGGYACAEWLNRYGFKGPVSVVSDDADPPYDRTVCSKQYLIGMTSRDQSLLRNAFAGNFGLRLNSRAVSIDTVKRELWLEGGERISFDVLVLATGAESRRPQWPGCDFPNVHVLRTLRDADALIRASERAKRVAIVGSSFIGLEAAASLKQRKLEVHIVTPEDVPLKTLLGRDVGRMIQAVHEAKGVQFHFGREIRSFDGGRLMLDDYSLLEADFVVAGVGVRPRTEIAEAAGITCIPPDKGGGVVVNDRLESSVAGIYAIGDIAHYPDPHTHKNIRVEHWVHAQRQGQHVARAILGQRAVFRDVPFFWSAHFDTGLRYLGHVDSVVSMRTHGSVEARNFARCYRGHGDEKAFVTCNRDKEALEEESAWDGAAL
jgi:apoptosis-inducing factor 3